MKKAIMCLCLAITTFLTLPIAHVSADSLTPEKTETHDSESIVYYIDGATIEISAPRIISPFQSDLTVGTRSSTTAEIDAKYTNPSGTVEWKYTLHATFSYTYGVSSTCTSAWYTQNIYSGNWEFSNGAATKSGNRASGTGVYEQKLLFIVIKTYNINLVLTCDKYGVVS